MCSLVSRRAVALRCFATVVCVYIIAFFLGGPLLHVARSVGSAVLSVATLLAMLVSTPMAAPFLWIGVIVAAVGVLARAREP